MLLSDFDLSKFFGINIIQFNFGLIIATNFQATNEIYPQNFLFSV